MNVPEQLMALAKISLVEDEIVGLRQKIKLLPEPAEAIDAGMEVTQKRYLQLAKDYDIILGERRQLERNLIEEKDKVRKWQSRAELIRKEREFTALMSEIGSQKRLINDIEDQLLEKMQILEDTEKPLHEIEDALNEAKEASVKAWNDIKPELDDANTRLSSITSERDALLDAFPKGLIAKYNRIADKRGNAISIIRNEVCTQCRYKIPPHMCQMVYRGDAVESCPSCQRLMVSEFNMESAAVTDAKPVEQNA